MTSSLIIREEVTREGETFHCSSHYVVIGVSIRLPLHQLVEYFEQNEIRLRKAFEQRSVHKQLLLIRKKCHVHRKFAIDSKNASVFLVEDYRKSKICKNDEIANRVQKFLKEPILSIRSFRFAIAFSAPVAAWSFSEFLYS